MSIGLMLADRTAPLIWRGPMKMTAIKQFIEENPEVWTPTVQERVRANIDHVVMLEDTFVADCMKGGDIVGMSRADFKEYIRYIADRRLESIGLDPLYGLTETPFPWMNEIMDLPKEKNFFETRVTEYQTGMALEWN
jgi:ribonucleoside-diphosphate reductase beta chain